MIDTLRETPINCNRISASFDQIKAVGALKISATAKYVGTVMLTTGAKTVAEICAVTGLPKSTVYRAQKEFAEQAFDAIPTIPSIPTVLTSENPTILTDGNCSQKTVPLVSPVRISDPEPSCVRDITTRATNELPSEVVILENNIPPLAPPSPKRAKPKSEKCGTRLSDEFELPEDWRQWALVNCPLSSPERVELEGRKFANHWQASSGQNARKRNWYKAWQNWCYRAFASAPVRPSASVPSWMERERQERRDFLAMARGELNG